MNGQLGEQPLAELIREISAKSIGGRLQLQHDRLKAVVYFDKGDLLYAASNLVARRVAENSLPLWLPRSICCSCPGRYSRLLVRSYRSQPAEDSSSSGVESF